MSDWEQLANIQESIGDEIRRVYTNLKKDPLNRRTPAYLSEKIERLKELWQRFEKNDTELIENVGADLTHEYCKKDYYTGIKAIYEQAIATATAMQSKAKMDAAQSIRPADEPSTAKEVYSLPEISVGLGPSSEPYLIKQINVLLDSIEAVVEKKVPLYLSRSAELRKSQASRIEQQWISIQKLHSRILDTEDCLPLYDLHKYCTVEDKVNAASLQLLGNTESNQHVDVPVTSSTIRLPEIQLPKFDGSYIKWPQFRDLFTQLVHRRALAGCQKLWYLQSSLSGEPSRLIQHLAAVDQNYDVAWQIITNRYQNKRLTVSTVLNKLMTQPRLSSSRATGLKELHDTTRECLLALQSMEIDISNWDPILVHIITLKLDEGTRAMWEQSLADPRALQSINALTAYLERLFQALEPLDSQVKIQSSVRKTLTSIQTKKCPMCKEDHRIYNCPKFLDLKPNQRISVIRQQNLCLNCLGSGHSLAACQSRACKSCGKKHNSLLHIEKKQPPATQPTSSPSSSTAYGNERESSFKSSTARATSATATSLSYVLLSTVMVRITNGENSITCRALLDSGSQLNFITSKIIKKLGLKKTLDDVDIEGVGSQKQHSKARVNIMIESCINNFKTRIEAFVLPQIISPQPSEHIDIHNWKLPPSCHLADPEFNKPGPIDVLIGADIYFETLKTGKIHLGKHLPIVQNTIFGWTLSGKVGKLSSSQSICGVATAEEALLKEMEWEWLGTSNDSLKGSLTSTEQRCELHYTQTVSRSDDGRFIVKLPFNRNPECLGESRDIAFRRFQAIQWKLSQNPALNRDYTKFMEEYEQLGHMEEVDLNKIEKPYYFLPHHAVFKKDSTSTRVRVVFDASAKTSTNIALNDVLAKGPNIQDDIFTVLARFRLHRYVFVTDIEKMYRQILISPEDRKYQLIWWQRSIEQKPKCFQLNTVTYGISSAPYLAIKTLKTLASNESDKFSLGSHVLSHDFNVDDCLTGCDSLSTTLQMQKQLVSLLRSAGFTLKKWCANHPQLLENIPTQDQEIELDFRDEKESKINIIGLTWSPTKDQFNIKTTWRFQSPVTKRVAFSEISRLYDPLGIMEPVIVTAKLFVQRLWVLKADWDEPLPKELEDEWKKFRDKLHMLNTIRFDRHVYAHKQTTQKQLHIFADASMKAYGAAAYLRSIDESNITIIRLLCAKSRVAPLKTITLPRLELCAAKIAAELAHRLKTDLALTDIPIYLWTDSEIVLSWINSESSSYQVYVANRVSTIQQLTTQQQWRHVPSKDNPADIVSRGLTPQALSSATTWFYGPRFLHGSSKSWSVFDPKKVQAQGEEKKKAKITNLATTSHNEPQDLLSTLVNRRNSFRACQRILGYILRFISRIQRKEDNSIASKELSATELLHSQKTLIRLIQEKDFSEELKQLKQFNEVSKLSPLNDLAPFLDDHGIIRVGGRLQEAALEYDAKHPMVLPYSNCLTKALLHDIHLENMHVGAQTLLAIARQWVWPVKGKILARSVVHQCLRCSKFKPKMLSQMMGNLPKHRVQPAKPFANAGVDFCGPIQIHFRIRGKQPRKAYIAVFVCFATKATHLEVVPDLTTEAFLGALRRFVARRGRCENIYCDNGTNFVGAKNQLKEVQTMLKDSSEQDKIKRTLSTKGIEFHFIPPRGPHFGGLWESAVKSAKHLLYRTLAGASLVYEELETIVVEAEAILNSRPLTPESSDPNDFSVLTPAHFLVGEPLTGVEKVEPSTSHGLHSRFKLVTQLKNSFWKRWSAEYLNQLQYRHKWKRIQENVPVNTMVLIKEDNIAPLRWPLGRIVKTIAGKDGLVRVAEIRTSRGVICRPIHKLAPLPIAVDHSSDEGATSAKSTEGSPSLSSSPEDDKPPPSKHRRIGGSKLMTVLMALLIVPAINCSPINITKFQNHPGIYFENLGATSLVSNEWNLVVYYDMKSYWKEVEFLSECVHSMKHICQNHLHPTLCNATIEHLETNIEQLTANNRLFNASHVTRRSKRGAINLIGNIANAPFGVLDSTYAQEMATIIDQLNQGQQHLRGLAEKQTTLLDATLNIVKGQQLKSTALIRQVVGDIKENIRNIAQEGQKERVFNTISIVATLSINKLLQVQANILDTLADTHHGQINPMLITPHQLSEELATIKTLLPRGLRLPINLTAVLNYFKVMTISGTITHDYAIFKIIIPLADLEDFEMFKLTSVPVLVNDTFITVQPSSAYLVITLHRDQYYPMNEVEQKLCILVSSGEYLCKQTHPVYRRGSSVSSCEIEMITHSLSPKSCRIGKLNNKPQWIQLVNPNQWIFALKDPIVVDVVCGQNTTHFPLQATGILQIQDQCAIKHQFITIQSHNVYHSSARKSFIPLFNITKLITEISAIPELQLSAIDSYTGDIDTLRKQILHVNTSLQDIFTRNDIHPVAVSYTSLLLTLAVVISCIVIIIRFYYRAHTRYTVPVPTPRTQQPTRTRFNTTC